jgi:PAS domain S-box-containing protein
MTARMTITIDSSGIVRKVSGGVSTITGHGPSVLVGQNVRLIIPQRFHSAHDRGFARWSSSGVKKAMGSWMSVPILHRDGSKRPVQMCLTERDGLVTGLITSDPDETLDPGELLDAVEARKVLEAELNIAQGIQRSMLPLTFPEPPQLNRLAVYADILAAREVGGDFYDFGRVDDDRFYVVVGDVSGKGVPAALFMAVVKTLLRSKLMSGMSPAAAFAATNNEVSASNTAMMFCTTWAGVVNLASGELTFANAGHNPALVVGANGSLRSLRDRHGIPIGPMEDQSYGQSTVNLGASDTLYVYTDGVTEACNLEGAFFGDERLEAWATQTGSAPLETAVASLMQGVLAFEGEAPRSDDVTILGIRRRSATD